jgi:hypothetical protein
MDTDQNGSQHQLSRIERIFLVFYLVTAVGWILVMLFHIMGLWVR